MNASPHAALNLEELKITPFQLLGHCRGEGEMCSTLSPDKCTLLQETVNQIRHIKLGEECGDELQKSEVSSSNVNPFIGSQLIAPFLLHALDGFCFVVNADGKIEYMSPNVESFLKYNSDSLVDSSIYNIIHVGDHSRFSSNLLPMSIGNGFNWTGEGGGGENPSFQCRFLVRPPSDSEETMEEKQTRVSLYEQMSVTTVLLPKAPPIKAEEPQQEVLNRLICVARRVPPGERNGSGTTPEQFVTRLDARGKILSVDTANISSANLSFLTSSDLVGRIIQEVCHPEDFQKLTQHLKETLQQGSNTSGIYRLRFSNEKIICVQTKSKRTSPYNPMASEHEVIVASHTIVRDSSSDQQQQCMESVASPGSSLVPSLPLNGGFSFPSLSPQDFNLNDLDFLPTSSWDLATPAPPPEAPVESPHRPGQQGSGSSRSTTPFGGAGFSFSPAPKQEPISNGELGGGGSPPLERIPTSAQQQKLRNLLTHGGPPEEADSSKQQAESAPAPLENGFGSNGGDQGAVANENLILRELLNQEDEDMDTGSKDKRNNMLRKVSGGDLGGGPKRKSPDTPMEESMAKRPAPQPPTQPHAHLAGQNPMLASMLAQTPRTAPTVTTSLASAIVSQLPQERLPKNLEKKLVHTPYTGANPQGGSAPPPTYSFARGQHQQEVVTADARGHVTLGNPQHSFNQVNNNFLGHFGVGQNTANILIDGLAEAARDPSNVVSASDPLLSDILDQVWSMEQDMNLATDDLAFFKLLEELPDPSVQRPTNPPAPPVSQQVDAQEKLAIQSIQKQLMSCEPQQRQQLYPQPFQQPPPSYTRPPQQPQQRPPHYGGFNDLTPPMRRQLLEQHKHKVFLQQQYNQKKQQQLLLQQQQQQQQQQKQLNSMPGSPFGDSMSDLLNNSVAPNVTLQRSASMPEPQLSPRYSAPSPSSQLSPGQRGGFSPMGGGGYPPFPPQGQQQRHLTQQQQQWTQQQRANLQQQNPMLNAQLSQQQFAAGNAQRFSSQQQQQRQPMQQQQLGGVHSPRNSPYPPDFHPSSPGMFQQQPTPPAQRMQRAVSIPNRVNSPRGLGGSSFGGDPLLSPQPSPGSYSSPPVSNYGGYGGMDPNFPAYDQQTYPATLMDRNRGNGGGAIRSEYVRQELRAKVGARTQQHQQIHQQQQQQMVLPPGGSQSASQADFDALGFSLDLGNDVQPPSPALYSQSLMNSVGGDPQRTGSPRFQLEERPAEQKKSLLQQLLSEPP
ncbi:hypothetical protein JTE90_010221 [Oedothorax gibbosus]|uniref:PAS domain-containing protein n=1 Tax=Oedothorax gibbosus TaxID=931172 RepID=A0AAV6ULT0_9ARAC|nr:hypothetical protein JTE90_010221 [Oedothorax gibbosus]